MKTVYVLTIDNIDADAGGVHTSVHTTEEKARKFLAAFCRGDWEEGGHNGHLSTNDIKATEQYFAYWKEEMTWDISRHEVDPDPASVEQSPGFAAGPANDFFGLDDYD